MLKNHLLVAIRSLRRERLYTVINVLGLSVGLVVCLLVFAYVKYEWSFDRFHQRADSLFRVNYLIPGKSGAMTRSAGTAFVLAPILRSKIPEITSAVALADIPEVIISYQNEHFREPIQFADSEFFSVFSFPLIAGNPASALESPNSIVLSERMAAKYFGAQPAVGKTLSVSFRGKEEDYQVTGVCRNAPGNSSIEFDAVVPLRKLYSLYAGIFEFGWNLTWPSTYVLLKPGSSPEAVTSKLAELAKDLPVDNSGRIKISLGLQPISDIHYDFGVDNAPSNAGRPLYSYVLMGIAGLVLLLACINFMTLAVGRSQTRAREVGIRKVMGAEFNQVLVRFLGEAVVLSAIAVLIGLVLAELLLPAFNELAGKQILATIWLDWTTVVGILLLVAVTSLVAGGYPAIVLARTKLSDAVRGRARMLTGVSATRALIVLQFGLSIALVLGALIMSGQLRYLLSVPLGFDHDRIAMVKVSGSGAEKVRMINLLRNALADNVHVASVCASGRSFDGHGMANSDYLPDSTLFTVYADPADEYFVATMGLKIIEGTNFTGSNLPDSLEPLLVNEKLVRDLHWQSAIGQRIPGLDHGRVIGVVNDFNYVSLAQPIEPVIIPYANSDNWSSEIRYVYFRINGGEDRNTIAAIQQAWRKAAPNLPFDLQFMNDHIRNQYQFEQRWWRIVGYSSALAILVACFGAVGLTSLAVARRQKEIGIRKVLGATSRQVLVLMNIEFIWLIAAGNLIAWPAAYLLAKHWLGGFAYRIGMSPVPFLLSSAMTMVIVIVTVSLQSLQAVHTNPVDSLRHE